MESKTFIYKNQLALSVQPGAVKALSVQGNAAFVTVEARGIGLLKLGLDVAKLVGMGQHDLDFVSNTLVNAVFRYDDTAIPVISLSQLKEDGGNDKGGTPPATVIPVGPSIK